MSSKIDKRVGTRAGQNRRDGRSPGLALAVTAVIAMSTSMVQARETISFSDSIRPLLADHCIQCHGPDDQTREADLRLDKREGLFGGDGTEGVIIPGNPDASELIARILTTDEDDIMPPPETKKPLSESQKALLQEWVAAGAPFEEHWAFVTPEEPAIPARTPTSFHENPIDYFVESRLAELGMEPSPEADRRTLIRRATLDLTGLPPTVGEVERFVNDPDPNAYEKLVDELLSSERYGERMTLAWMDAARYGDSSVFHADGVRDMWPWRDWVINAYNNNMPFDQFTVEQLAGDLIPDATVSQKVASGFNRNHGTTDEGGAIAEEYRVEYIVDRVKTTSNVWLGLSMECAQCHDHKYDPISQKEYYQFYAYFNRSSDPGMQTRNGNTAPLVRIYQDSQQDQLNGMQTRLASLRNQLKDSEPGPDAIRAWAASVARSKPRVRPDLGPWYQTGPFTGDNQNQVFNRKFGPEESSEIDLEAKYVDKAWVEKEYADGTAIDLGLPGNSAVYLYRRVDSAAASQWTASLGSDDAIKVFLNGREVLANNASRGVAPDQDKATLDLNEGPNHLVLKIVNGGGGSGFYFDLRESGLPSEIAALIARESDSESLTEEESSRLRSYYLENVWEDGRKLRQDIAALESDRKALMDSVVTSMTMGDMEDPRMTYILDRGHYASPREDEEIFPGVPAALPPLPADAPSNRLGLARWLVDEDHPLTARVAVNRYWMMFFGDGLVATEADFGTRGAQPTNQELLDWLAVDFVRSGWDVKRMIRLMLTSGTYRQSSRVMPRHLEADPENRFLSRGPRFRLQGEFIRDNALALSGLLNDRIGGPSVKPYQPPRIWNEVSLDGGLFYQRDDGEKLYRRSMYIYWKRSAPNPSMVAFDAPTREKCVIQRQRTNTPLQALVTMNDITFVEAARVWAQNLIQQMPDASFEERVNQAFIMATSKPVDRKRMAVLRKLYQNQKEHYRSHPEMAAELAIAGEYPRPEGIDDAEHAALTLVTSAILNLDEVLTRD